jgi:CheY-like chemotaxis protein
MTTPTPARRILIIDDDPGMTTLCRRILDATGQFTVKEENDPWRALDTAREYRPHLIYLDRRMPGKDGAQIAAELARDGTLKDVPIIFLTGAAECGAHVDGHPVLLKPVRGTDLIAASVKHSLVVM